MADEDPRIAQFKQMAEADPTNELGHMSLGKMYLQASRFGEAAASLARVVELNPKLSKAYQLLGEAHEGAGEREKAVDLVTRGVTVADGQGDRMPRDAMAKMLVEWGAPVPAFAAASQTDAASGASKVATDGFTCIRCSRPGGQLEKAPFKGDLGRKVFDHVCTSCWQEWIGAGTKVINELALVLSTPAGQQAYDQYMAEFLQLENC